MVGIQDPGSEIRDPRSGIRDPRSGIRDSGSKKHIPDTGSSRGKKNTGSRILGPQHCKKGEENRPEACEVLLVVMAGLPAGVGEGEVNQGHLRLPVLRLGVLVRLRQRRLTQLNRQTGHYDVSKIIDKHKEWKVRYLLSEPFWKKKKKPTLKRYYVPKVRLWNICKCNINTRYLATIPI